VTNFAAFFTIEFSFSSSYRGRFLEGAIGFLLVTAFPVRTDAFFAAALPAGVYE
jgi:hypothetical protein